MTAPTDKQSDVGPWVVRRDETRQWRICSENFTHDVELIITGDFKDDAETVEYAADIARRLSTRSAGEGRSATIHEHDCPTAWAFFNKHGLGSKLAPSCLVCGKVEDDREKWAIRHMELPNIYVCAGCVSGARSARERSMDEARAIGLLRAVCDEWYTFTPYSELKASIDGLLDKIDAADRRAE